MEISLNIYLNIYNCPIFYNKVFNIILVLMEISLNIYLNMYNCPIFYNKVSNIIQESFSVWTDVYTHGCKQTYNFTEIKMHSFHIRYILNKLTARIMLFFLNEVRSLQCCLLLLHCIWTLNLIKKVLNIKLLLNKINVFNHQIYREVLLRINAWYGTVS